MKKTGYLLVFMLVQLSAFGQDLAYKEGQTTLSIGSGTPNMNRFLYTWNNDYSVKGLGPLHVRLTHGISRKIEMGFSLNYSFVREQVLNAWGWGGTFPSPNPRGTAWNADIHYVSFLLRMNLHFATDEKIDPYLGIAAGAVKSFKSYSPVPGWDFDESMIDDLYFEIPFGMEIVAGMRYYLNPKFALYTELGMAKSVLQIGATFKLGNK